MTKKAILTIAAVSVLGGGFFVATSAFAQTPTKGQNGVPSLVQEIADKLRLNTSDVQSVFNQHRQEVQAKQEANYENYLANLVSKGKITDAQKQLLITKHKELISKMESNKNNFKNMTPAERKAQMQVTKQDVQTWAQQNGIDPKYLHSFGPGMHGFGRFMHDSNESTPSQ